MLFTSRRGESPQREHNFRSLPRRDSDRNDARGSLHPRKGPDQVDIPRTVHANFHIAGRRILAKICEKTRLGPAVRVVLTNSLPSEDAISPAYRHITLSTLI